MLLNHTISICQGQQNFSASSDTFVQTFEICEMGACTLKPRQKRLCESCLTLTKRCHNSPCHDLKVKLAGDCQVGGDREVVWVPLILLFIPTCGLKIKQEGCQFLTMLTVTTQVALSHGEIPNSWYKNTRRIKPTFDVDRMS